MTTTAASPSETIRRLSDDAFKLHQITELSRNGVFRSWRCGRPDRGVYAFMITTTPGCLIITGDIGDLIVERMYDMLPWCRRSVDSTSYFASKVPSAIPTKEFSEQKCREWIQEQIAEIGGREWMNYVRDEASRHRLLEVLDDAMGDLNSGEHGDQHMYTATSEVWQGNDPPNFMDWNSNFLWCRDAIRWFVTHHDEPEITPSGTPS
jgi:hypothetical protein